MFLEQIGLIEYLIAVNRFSKMCRLIGCYKALTEDEMTRLLVMIDNSKAEGPGREVDSNSHWILEKYSNKIDVLVLSFINGQVGLNSHLGYLQN